MAPPSPPLEPAVTLVPPLSVAARPATGLGWLGPAADLLRGPALEDAVRRVDTPLVVVSAGGAAAVAQGGQLTAAGAPGALPVLAVVPATPAASLGSAAFRADHGVRLAYMAGAMANGISSEELVEAMGRAGLLASFGAAGLPLDRLAAAAQRLSRALPQGPWAANLIHTPDDPERELAVVELYRRHGVRTLEVSAFMDLRPAVVLFRLSGLQQAPDGGVRALHRVITKLSRPEVALPFLQPPPPDMVAALVRAGLLTPLQARLGEALPVATDITVEADSGGHTDRRPLVCLLPAILQLRDRLGAAVHVGAAGGIGTPEAAAAAFALGADYVVTGSINQACVEAGTSERVKRALAEARQEDVTMAPAADMFEEGVKVQVLQRGTLYAARARRLYELYLRHPSLEDLPVREREAVEGQILRAPVEEAWRSTAAWLAAHRPALLDPASRDPRLRMALVFRSYLGQSSDWATRGDPERALDYQVWCGPAMGAFNQWVEGTPLQPLAARRVVDMADQLMAGAAHRARVEALRNWGLEPRVDLRRRPPAAPAALSAPTVPTPTISTPTASTPSPAPTTGANDAEALRAWLVDQVARELGVAPDDIDVTASFASLSLDSARALVLLTELERRLQRKLSPTIVWNYPTIERLAARLARG